MNSVKLQAIMPTYRNLLCFYNLKENTILIIIIATKRPRKKILTNKARDLSSGNYKTLMKEKVKTQVNAQGLEELAVNVFVLPKANQIQCNSYQNSNCTFHR